ncbi:MAG: methenyltetrahydromethanopterin cyclohydrolase, partial [Clostridiales bacterium]
NAFTYVEKLINNAEYYKIHIHEIRGATVIDCGINTQGGWEAGAVFAAVCLGGLGKVTLKWQKFEDLSLPAVEVYTDHPVVACMGSQYAGWSVKKNKYFAIGSGP